MIVLALIPAAALLVIVILCLRAKHTYNQACATVANKAETMRQERMVQDEENDASLVTNIVGGEKPLAELIADFTETRKGILPEVRRSDPANWTNNDLQNFVKRWVFTLNVQHSRKILYSTALMLLGIVAVSGTLAAWRYSALSNEPSSTPGSVPPSTHVDPFAAFSAK